MTTYCAFLITNFWQKSWKQSANGQILPLRNVHIFYGNNRITLSQPSSRSACGDVLTFRRGAYKPYLYHCRAKDKRHHKVLTKQVLTFCIEFIKTVFTQDLYPHNSLEK